jgi:hypothetical protein
MTALGGVFGGPDDRRKSVGKWYFRICISAQGGDGVKKPSAMPDNTDAQILQVVCRQGRQDHLVDLIFAECRLISLEAKAPQPTPDVHHRALTLAGAYPTTKTTRCCARAASGQAAAAPPSSVMNSRRSN